MSDVLNIIFKCISDRWKIFIIPINVDCIMKSINDELYKKIIDEADLVVPDGMPIIWASKFLNCALKERITGADLLVKIFEHSTDRQLKIFLYGTQYNVLCSAKEKIERNYSNVSVVGLYSPPFRELTEAENEEIINYINASEAEILFVALGAPKQEKWIYKNKDKLTCNVLIPCGAAIDFVAGKKERAPMWLQRLGFEWLFRLIREPKRLWRRYLIENPPFFFHVLRQKIQNYL
ncbi:MAG: WecB/TagA/CpsF family glycosyltransferase [Eubacteriales bacterium]|nr:WecB/TagA/CpsF family glycosyltransferase [Eubacteriales bacterium]